MNNDFKKRKVTQYTKKIFFLWKYMYKYFLCIINTLLINILASVKVSIQVVYATYLWVRSIQNIVYSIFYCLHISVINAHKQWASSVKTLRSFFFRPNSTHWLNTTVPVLPKRGKWSISLVEIYRITQTLSQHIVHHVYRYILQNGLSCKEAWLFISNYKNFIKYLSSLTCDGNGNEERGHDTGWCIRV